ncbi:MAG: polysaccharide deacetylase family protein [Gammaproteobacteria bacterium]|nr:polysaccharide deacetylase family protein [Gammaproteobacteria bacterium]
MKHVSVLLYHALWASAAEREAIDAEDRPYAVSVAHFRRQLLALREAGIPVLDPALLESGAPLPAGVLLTFDDGHASNALHALPILQELGMRAAFFVTTGFVHERPGYCTWEQIRLLADSGMTVGGHGHSHRFISDLPATAQHDELHASRESLQRHLERPVVQMSFPGGRCDAQSIAQAGSVGFTVLYSSRIGTLRAQVAPPAAPIPRIAVRAATAPAVFMDYARASRPRMVLARTASGIKGLTKRLIGNERYHQLYARLRG